MMCGFVVVWFGCPSTKSLIPETYTNNFFMSNTYVFYVLLIWRAACQIKIYHPRFLVKRSLNGPHLNGKCTRNGHLFLSYTHLHAQCTMHVFLGGGALEKHIK